MWTTTTFARSVERIGRQASSGVATVIQIRKRSEEMSDNPYVLRFHCHRDCKHIAFFGQHIKCKTCDVFVAKDTGHDCARCGKRIMKKKGDLALNFLCVDCSKFVRDNKIEFGLSTDANPRFCYWIQTGISLSIPECERIFCYEDWSKLSKEDRKVIWDVLQVYRRMDWHSMAGSLAGSLACGKLEEHEDELKAEFGK